MKIPNQNEIKKIRFTELKNENYFRSLTGRKGFYPIIKRIIDIVLSLSALIVFLPLWILIILAIWIDSGFPAIFMHERVGKNGKVFRLYKFRTMRHGVSSEEFAPTSLSDKRITSMGRILRRTSLDEVPQFWNVLRGEMSVVGPRPEMQFIVREYDDMQKKRLIVTPGLTGLWQIFGRKDLPLHENAEYDYYYIMHRSLVLDLLIMIKTISVVISGKGAY
jgi:lipopolysaccharide/colanic/teichoic acid biosynthesis glycosyltransferase